MNFTTIFKPAIKLAQNDYAAGRITSTEIGERCRRIGALRRRSQELESLKNWSRRFNQMFERARGRFLEALGENRPIIALDAGWDMETNGPVEEVGVTTYQGGTFSTITLVDEAKKKTRMGKSSIGPITALPFDDMIQQTQRWYNEAAICVFHTAYVDVPKLGIDTSPIYYLDTAQMATRWQKNGEYPSLLSLANRYGIPSHNHHQSGDDSRVTLEVALAQMIDRSPAYYRY